MLSSPVRSKQLGEIPSAVTRPLVLRRNALRPNCEVLNRCRIGRIAVFQTWIARPNQSFDQISLPDRSHALLRGGGQ